MKTRGKGVATRILDIVVSLLLLPFILMILIPAMVAVKVTSPGPVFFRQTRYGQDKQPFKIYKLRTMTMTVCEDGAAFRQAVKGDAHITPIGRLLRASSGDELPQIFNVLLGDMSLVGSRPHATAHDDHFMPTLAGYDRRFGVRPGITGLAQVRSQRGPTETVDVMRARAKRHRICRTRVVLAGCLDHAAHSRRCPVTPKRILAMWFRVNRKAIDRPIAGTERRRSALPNSPS